MRSSDAGAPAGVPALGVRLGGLGPGGRERLHYPDLLLLMADGRRIAIELELTSKGRGRREQILGGYAAEVTIDAVLYLAPTLPLARAIQASAARMAIDRLVKVQMISLPSRDPGGRDRRGVERRRQRVPGAEVSR